MTEVKAHALVTGGSGFIGKRLVQELMRNGYEVTVFDRKPANTHASFVCGDIVSFDFDDVLKDVDVVFHLAGLLGTTELFHRIVEAEKVNVLGTLNLLESMRKNNVTKIVFTSKPNVWKYNVYTVTKENCERYLEMYREIYGFKCVITRAFNVYGPDEPLKEYRKAIPYFIVSALRNEPLEIFGDGQQTMDAIYVDDVAEALLVCAEKLLSQTIDIGNSRPVRVKDVADQIIMLTGSASEVVFKPMRKGESNPRYICANETLWRLLGFKPKISLVDGLTRTIKWYREHLDEFREIYKFSEWDFA